MSALLLVLLSAAALFCAFKLASTKKNVPARFYADDRESNAVHLLMNGTMALMLTPLYDEKARIAVIFAYWLAIFVLAVRIAIVSRSKNASVPDRHYRIASGVYHLFSILAMIYATYLMPAMTAGEMKMTSMPAEPGWPSFILGGIFLFDAVVLGMMVFVFPRMLLTAMTNVGAAGGRGTGAKSGSDAASIRELRAGSLPHIVMDVGMAAMLLMSV